jgi:hypothetical protein
MKNTKQEASRHLKELFALVGIVYIQITQENTSKELGKKCN